MIVYLNGEYVDAHSAHISPFDRGFLFGDGVYEVVAVYQGCLYQWASHAKRLSRSLERIRLSPPVTMSALRTIGETLLTKNQLHNATFYLQITRGAVVGKRDHYFTAGLTPTVFAYVNEWPEAMTTERAQLRVVTVNDDRWDRSEIKSVNLLANTQAREMAHRQGIDEAIFIRDGLLVEGTSSNVFVVINNVLITPPERPYMLSGITREVLLRLADAHGQSVEIREISEKELSEADEVWITSTIRELRLVSELNGRRLPDTAPAFTRMREWFNQDKQNAIVASEQRA